MENHSYQLAIQLNIVPINAELHIIGYIVYKLALLQAREIMKKLKNILPLHAETLILSRLCIEFLYEAYRFTVVLVQSSCMRHTVKMAYLSDSQG